MTMIELAGVIGERPGEILPHEVLHRAARSIERVDDRAEPVGGQHDIAEQEKNGPAGERDRQPAVKAGAAQETVTRRVAPPAFFGSLRRSTRPCTRRLPPAHRRRRAA
jgi:hypothetical protein